MTEDEFLQEVSSFDLDDTIFGIHYDFVAYVMMENLWKINIEQRIVYLIVELQFQIWAGWFREYFFFTSGRYAHEALEALKVLGASKSVKMFETVINYWPNATDPQEVEIRRQLLNTVLKPALREWQSLYEKYAGEITEVEDLFEQLYGFILANSTKFYL